MINLLCPECRRENEPERIYCHDCGARLDRSALAKIKNKEEDPKETQRRLRNMLTGRKAKLRHQFFQGSQLLLSSLALATLVQAVRAPDLPKRPDAASLLPSQINLDLENAAMDPRMGPLHYTEEQINNYLAYTLKVKRAALSKYLQFEGAVVSFEEGFCRLTVERSLFGWPLFTSIVLTAQAENGSVAATPRGGGIGRLPVDPALMKHAGFLFADVKKALERERKLVSKLGGVTFQPKLVIFRPKGPMPQPALPQPALPRPEPQPQP